LPHTAPPPPPAPTKPFHACRGLDEDGADNLNFERDYQDEHSWEQLEEDEHGNLRSVVSTPALQGPPAPNFTQCPFIWSVLCADIDKTCRLQVDKLEAQRARQRRLLSAAHGARIRRGMIRYLELVLDLSRAAGLTDMRPLRSVVMFAVVQRFIRKFFDENPLSQLGIILLRNGVAHQLTELSSSPVSAHGTWNMCIPCRCCEPLT